MWQSPVLIWIGDTAASPTKEDMAAIGREYAQRYTLAPPNNRIFKTAAGKPYFEQGGVHISISHSGDYLAWGFAPFPIGLDIQEKRPCRHREVAKRFFHPLEGEYVDVHGIEGFYPIWAAKESFVKYTGTGFGGGFSEFSTVSPEGEILGQCSGGFLQHLDFKEGYSLCLCTPCPARCIITIAGE